MADQELDVELAAGGLLWRDAETRTEIAVIYRERHKDWSLPKGKFERPPDDGLFDTAVREVKEETGCNFNTREFADCISYLAGSTPKIVLFWNMEFVEKVKEPEEETDILRWMSVPDALEKLDHPEQQAVVARAANQVPSVASSSGSVRKHWWRKLRSMGFWPRGNSHGRLSSELATFQTELSHLIRRVKREQGQRELQMLPWAQAACLLLDDAQAALNENDTDRGWRCFLAAQRLELFGLDELGCNALRTKAQSIAREADDKLKSWRITAVEDQLGKRGELKDDITVTEVYEASIILHGHFNNQYHKIGLLKRQSSMLAIIALITTIVILSIHGIAEPLFGPGVEMAGGWFVFSVALFGVVGASVSGFLALAKAGTRQKIPNQMVSSWVTLARPMIGAAAALVLFGSFQSGLLQIANPTPGLALVVSFAAGGSERLLDRAVRTVEGR